MVSTIAYAGAHIRVHADLSAILVQVVLAASVVTRGGKRTLLVAVPLAFVLACATLCQLAGAQH